MYPRVPATILKSRFFDILFFSNFTVAEMRQKGDFWQNIAIFSPKSPFWRISAAVKLEKSKISKKRLLTIVADTLRYIYTHFWINWIISHRLDTISVEKKIAHFLPSQQKNGGFLAKNRRKIFENFQNFGNQYKPIYYTSSPKFGSFGPFLAKKWLFLSIFGPYLALLIYKGMWRPAVIPPLTLLAITFEPLIRFKKSWTFWKALELGYQIVSKRKKSEKKCITNPPNQGSKFLFLHIVKI